jgi:RNA polymerase sigma factor (sigma-70 family)
MAWVVRSLANADRDALSDRDLLSLFATRGDQTAFAAVVARHTGMVFGVCRRMLANDQDAEDACQAVFLLLAKKASRVRWQSSAVNWLYTTARQVANNARLAAARRNVREATAAVPNWTEPADEMTGREFVAILDEELQKLPARYREPLLLCCLEGLTRDEAAQRLGVPAIKLKNQLERGRKTLAAALTARGCSLGIALLTSTVSATAVESLSNLRDTIPAAVAGSPSPAAAALAKGVVVKGLLFQTKMAALAIVGILGATAISFSLTSAPRVEAEPPEAKPAPEKATKAPQPPGELRLGTPTGLLPGRVFFSADSATLIGTAGANVDFWNAATVQRSHSLALPTSNIRDADFSAKANLMAVVGMLYPDDKNAKPTWTIFLVDTATRKLVRSIPVQTDVVISGPRVRLTPDGKQLILAFNGELRVLDTASGGGDLLIAMTNDSALDICALSPDGTTVILGFKDLYLWDWKSGQKPKKFRENNGIGAKHTAFSPDGGTFYVAFTAGTITKYEVPSGKQSSTVDLPNAMGGFFLSPDGKSLAICNRATSQGKAAVDYLQLVDPATGQEQARFNVGRSVSQYVSWSPDGQRMAIASPKRLWVWDLKTKKPLGPPQIGHEDTVVRFAFGRDGRIFTGSDDYTLRSWDAAGQPGLVLQHEGWVRGVAVSPGGTLIASSSVAMPPASSDVRIWDAKTGKLRFKLIGHGWLGGHRYLQFTQDGKRLISWGEDLYLRIWDTRNGKLLAEYRTLSEDVVKTNRDISNVGSFEADLSRDGSTFAIYSNWTNSVHVFDTETGTERTKLSGPANKVKKLALSPDGKRIVMMAHPKTTETATGVKREPKHDIELWDLATQKRLWQAQSDAEECLAVAYSPDGSRIAEAPLDEGKKYAVRVYDAADGKLLGRIEQSTLVWNIAFNDTGKKLAVGQQDATAIIYDLDAVLKPNAPK